MPIESREFKIGVLASGGGSTFEAIYHAIEQGNLPGVEIAFVACNNGPNNPSAGVWERANRLHVPIYHVSNATEPNRTFPEVDGEEVEGAISHGVSNRLLDLADSEGIGMYVALGYMRKIIGRVLQEVPITNNHPGPLGPKLLTAGEHGDGVQEKVLRLGLSHSGPTMHWMDTRVDENGLPAYDSGPEIGHEPVEVTEEMKEEWARCGTVKLLKEAVMDVEKKMTPRWITRARDQVLSDSCS